MRISPYRHVLSLPGVRGIVLLGFFARIPVTAVGIALTLHVVNALHRGYGAAGLITAAYTVGSAVGSPLAGRFLDRRGGRPVVAVTTLVQAACWAAVPVLPYPALIGVAAVAGMFCVPVWGLVRQSLSTAVPEEHRRPAFALDSMAVEVSFMIGPAAAVALSTSLGSRPAIALIGTGIVLAGVLLFVMNPQVRPDGVDAAGAAVPRRTWVGPPLVAILVAGCVATFILSGTDLTIVATLRQAGAVSLTGVVIALWCAYSLIGGLIFGGLRRGVPVLGLVLAMGLLTAPIGLAPSWQVLCVALVPAGLLCAPTVASANDTLSRLVPATSRGEAMGWFSSAMTAGTSLGSPFAGLVIDHVGPGAAFAAAGAVGAVAALVAIPAARSRTRTSAGHPAPGPALALSTARDAEGR
ncbi:MFS transporter [Rugosimonospora africana]|uniref:MFS transporter n=1 Tax=Rugosimonospora africana TaxID=556532 RepID=A0A8J3VW64_9ACTN|nr:MFS transporter [Rugosimonospora africana]GIH20501.1 MFS transporter [Rugosimonospora africana]